MIRTCIIGAGITGITLANELTDAIILEKSRGIGGRIASRRLNGHPVSHGAPDFDHVKDLAIGLDIRRQKEVTHFEINDSIRVCDSRGEVLECENLIFTSPAPQTKTILERSGLRAPFLEDVTYKSEIQFMVAIDESTDASALESFFSLKKKTQNVSLYVLKPQFLQEFLEKDKEDIRNFCLTKIKGNVLDSHAHKWRYSEVTNQIHPKFQFEFKDKKIYLAGDYFDEAGVLAALTSSKRITAYLMSAR